MGPEWQSAEDAGSEGRDTGSETVRQFISVERNT